MAQFKKVSDGNWSYRIYYRKDGVRDSKYKSGFKTERAAKREAAKVEKFLDEGYMLSADKIVFSDHMQLWFEIYKKGKNSLENDKDIQFSCNRVKEYFGKTHMNEITRDKYQKFLNWYGEKHSTASVSKVHIYAKMCLQDAQHDGLLMKDPTYRVVVKGKVEPKKESEKFLHEREAIALINELKETWHPKHVSKTMIFVAYATGVRFSEALGLTWDDIDFEENTISINKTFDYKYKFNFKPTKSKNSMRTLKIDPDTMNYLKKWKIYQMEFLLRTGIRNKLNLVFFNTLGKAISNNAPNKVLKNTCKKLGIQEISFHGLRHTHISILLYHEVSIYSVSRRAGHSSPRITQEVYAHIVKELEEKDEDKILEILEAIS